LTKPDATSSGLLCCGLTQNDGVNKIVGFSDITSQPKIWEKEISGPVRDIHWKPDQLGMVLAIGSELSTLHFGNGIFHQDTLVIHPWEEIHTDDIREIAISPHESNLMISCGFDKRIIVSDIQQSRPVRRFFSRHVVGSVRWHPSCGEVVSYTCDNGSINLFDIRENSARLPVISRSQNISLYAHEYVNDNTILLGYADGTLELFEIRKKEV